MKYLFLILFFCSCKSDKELITKFDAAIFESLSMMEKQNDRLQIEITVDEYSKCRCDSADAFMYSGYISIYNELNDSYTNVREAFERQDTIEKAHFNS
ncbi:MAG: hypothetical protein IPL98_11730 [Saprospiraceae bacterium]|nr:hypothetical protein [Saprospiraceae bacterium]